MLKLIRIWLIFIVAIMVNSAGADVYRWVDKDGTIYYTATPRGKVKSEDSRRKINSYSSPNVSSNKYSSSSISKPVKSSEVVMYSTTWCGYCKKARRYFKQKKIRFKEYDVEKSTKGKKDYKALRGKGVPIILVGDRRMNGFSVDSFKRIYQ